MFYIFVNGNCLHDEGAHDESGRVVRDGGGALAFTTKSEAETTRDVLFARDKRAFDRQPLSFRRGRPAPRKGDYVVAPDPPRSETP